MCSSKSNSKTYRNIQSVYSDRMSNVTIVIIASKNALTFEGNVVCINGRWIISYKERKYHMNPCNAPLETMLKLKVKTKRIIKKKFALSEADKKT